MMSIEEKREKNRIKNKKWRQENKEKYLECASRYRNANRQKLRDYKLSVRYGISLKEYSILYKSQNGKCDICGKEEVAIHNSTKTPIKLAVDHCHSTTKIRGLLCQDCNRGLGHFHDDIIRMESAIKYLRKHRITI
jgi:hypothetical protein